MTMNCSIFLLILIKILNSVKSLELPGSCNPGQYYEPGLLTCQSCPGNSSMITSSDGFACSCAEHSIPAGRARCKPCNATEVVSSDGTSCVPRRCQNSSGRFVCRKCPNDYISVTQNFDGSPMKEMLCVKCARGYKVQGNACVRCESCACPRNHIIVRGICIPKTYVNSRPKYEKNRIHPSALLDVVKHEYLCTINDIRACRTLASECVRDFYSIDPAGPCRLWIQNKSITTKDLPPLSVDSTSNDKDPGQFILPHGKDSLLLVVALLTSNGGMKLLQDANRKNSLCQLPIQIRIGNDISHDCDVNISELNMFDYNETLAPYLNMDGDFKQVPVTLRTPDGHSVQSGTWPTNKFRRYFMMDERLSTTANITNVVLLRTLLVLLRIEKGISNSGSLLVHISIEAQYALKSLASSITSSLKVRHEMPSAGVVRGLEIWGGVLGSLLTLYAVVQWRGNLRRGGYFITFVPIVSGAFADALYFAAWFSTLHALAAEAGTLGLTLPLSRSENNIIKAFIYSAVSLKAVKVAWLNWNQCRCDVFFLDWSEYNPTMQDSLLGKSYTWRTASLAREWNILQTIRRVSPGFTVTFALLILKLLSPWQSYLPQTVGYKWAVACIAWWSSYTILLTVRWILDRFIRPPPAGLPRVCTGVGLSLLVFQEEYYAHYVHGRHDDTKDVRSVVSPLATCRVVCAPQLRAVYKQLSVGGLGLGESESRQALLSRFLAAFFERALDGLSWVASERKVLERLLDVELTVREAGNTSTLLYDPDNITPSCVAVTWWGEEWSLATFDNMLFSCIFISVDDSLLAALVTVIVWQVMKHARIWFGKKNQF